MEEGTRKGNITIKWENNPALCGANFLRRVWSWLRTNAGGVPKTCKSNEDFGPSGERRSNTWAICPEDGDIQPKGWAIPDVALSRHRDETKQFFASGEAHGLSASWWGNGLPRRRRVGGLRGWSPRVGLRHGPHTYGWQQLGILPNGGNSEAATPRGGRRI